ncbi:MAG: hypothetical protein IKN03_03275 [Fibrobacter sp.]|nr:hypothetical protein [Fibrobacter sp.]
MKKVRHAGGASAASLGYAGLQAARRNTRFARYCEEYTLADALFSRCHTTTISLIKTPHIYL